MFPLRKRKLYTPVTPPEDEENEENKINQLQRAVALKKNQVPEKITTFNEKFAFKKCPKEAAQNLEWKLIKAFLRKDPILTSSGSDSIRFNAVAAANSTINVNIDDNELKKDENLNILDLIAQKRNKVDAETSVKHIIHQKQSIQVSCESLKSVFIEHDEGISVETAKALATDSREGFISSHLKASPDEVEASDDKPCMNQETLNADWINEFMSSPMPATRTRANPHDRGIFPQTPSLSRSRKKINKNRKSTRFLED